MTSKCTSIELASWWQSPPGRLLLTWEQQQLDAIVSDLFGFHALQLGLPELEALRANRMPQRWVATQGEQPLQPVALPPVDGAVSTLLPLMPGAALLCDFDALPFAADSLDLVVLPHALELAHDPHETLREVERVLRPEGRVVIIGFNPNSLWGLRQQLGRWCARLALAEQAFVPCSGEFIGPRRARDWLRLLSFEVEHCRFGCWRPPLRSEAWLQRWSWLDGPAAQALPGLGAVYALQAVKRVRGMRLVALARRRQSPSPAPRAVVTQLQPQPPAATQAPTQGCDQHG